MKPRLCNELNLSTKFKLCNASTRYWYRNGYGNIFGRCEMHKMGSSYIPNIYTEATEEEVIIYEIMES